MCMQYDIALSSSLSTDDIFVELHGVASYVEVRSIVCVKDKKHVVKINLYIFLSLNSE